MKEKFTDLVDVTTRLVVHLLGAVEHVDHHAQGPTQVLSRLGLSSTSGSGRSPAHDQMQGLSQGDVAAIGEWSDHKSRKKNKVNCESLPLQASHK